MSVAVADGVFVHRPDGARLIAGRRKTDGEVRFPMPKGADAALGYVEFAGQVIAEGRILVDDPSTLKIGQPMKVDLEAFPTSTRGEVLTYAFRPA